MSVQINGAMSLLFAAFTLGASAYGAASPADVDAANAQKVSALVGDLCYQVVVNVDAGSTDSTEDTTQACIDAHPASADASLSAVNSLVHGICLKAPSYNDDYLENTRGLSAAGLKALKNTLIHDCFNDAKSLRIKAGLNR